MKKVVWILVTVIALSAPGCGESTNPQPRSDPIVPSSATDDSLPDVVQLRCDEDGATLLTPEVRPQADGVHIRIESTFDTGFAWQSGGDNAPKGVSHHVLPITPGRSEIGCYLRDINADPDMAALTVRDPDNVWVAPHLDCRFITSGTPEYAPGARGEEGDPVELTRREFAEPGDEVIRVGYVERRIAQVLVERDGRGIHLVEWWPTKGGRWLMDQHQSCSTRE